METPPPFDFFSSTHIYFVRHSHFPAFRISIASSPKSRMTILRCGCADIDNSVAMLFPEKPSLDVVDLVRQLATKHRIPRASLPPEMASHAWFEALAIPGLVAHTQEFLGVSSVHSLRVLIPLDTATRDAQFAAEALALLRRKKAGIARAQRERQVQAPVCAVEAANEQKAALLAGAQSAELAREQEFDERIRAGYFLAPGHNSAEYIGAIGSLLERLNFLCNGFLRWVPVRPGSYELDFYFPIAERDALKVIHARLSSVVAFQEVPVLPGMNQGSSPFGAVERKFPLSRSNFTSHASIKISDSEDLLGTALCALKLGIRGLDLPVETSVLGFVANYEKPETPVSSPIPCDVRSIWDEAQSEQSPEFAVYLNNFELRFNGEPPALRFILSSPWKQDFNAPVVLLRLGNRGLQLGVQKIRLDTGTRETLSFKGYSADAAPGLLWRVDSKLAVASTLEEAIALRGFTELPVAIAPSFHALQVLDLVDGLAEIAVYLPSGYGVDWTTALHALIDRCAKRNILVTAWASRLVLKPQKSRHTAWTSSIGYKYRRNLLVPEVRAQNFSD